MVTRARLSIFDRIPDKETDNATAFHPWRNPRGGGASFAPYNRYSGNLGHRNDDESTMT